MSILTVCVNVCVSAVIRENRTFTLFPKRRSAKQAFRFFCATLLRTLGREELQKNEHC